jgi:hypothetical protein
MDAQATAIASAVAATVMTVVRKRRDRAQSVLAPGSQVRGSLKEIRVVTDMAR